MPWLRLPRARQPGFRAAQPTRGEGEEAGPLHAQPLPLAVVPAASKVVHSAVFDPPGRALSSLTAASRWWPSPPPLASPSRRCYLLWPRLLWPYLLWPCLLWPAYPSRRPVKIKSVETYYVMPWCQACLTSLAGHLPQRAHDWPPAAELVLGRPYSCWLKDSLCCIQRETCGRGAGLQRVHL